LDPAGDTFSGKDKEIPGDRGWGPATPGARLTGKKDESGLYKKKWAWYK